MDGRDVPPTSGVDFVAELEEKLKEIGVTSLCVGFPVLRDGLNGLRGRSSSETMPALAAVCLLYTS